MKDLYIVEWYGKRDEEDMKNTLYIISDSWEKVENKVKEILLKSDIKLKRIHLIENGIAFEAI